MNVFTRRGLLGATGALFAARPSKAAAERFFPVAGRLFFPNQAGGASNTDVLAQTQHLLYDDVSGRLRIQWPNLRATTGLGASGGAMEVGSGAIATATANLAYIDRTTRQLVTVPAVDWATGSTALTAPNGGLFDAVATIDAVRGDRVVLKFAGHFPAGMVWSQGQADIPGGDLFQFGSSPIPLRNTPSNSLAANLAYYGPCSIRAETAIGSWGVCGDSRNGLVFTAGPPASDAADNIWGLAGQAARLAGPRVPLVNVSVPGETAADFAVASQSPVRRSLLRQARSGGFFLLGTNDIIFQGKGATVTLALLDRIAAEVGLSAGAIVGTLDPAVTGGNTALARPGAPEAERRSFNAAVRARARRFDPAAANEAGGIASPTGLFASAAYVSADGTHESASGNQNAADTSGFDFALLGSPAVIDAGFAYAAGPAYQSLDLVSGWSAQHASLRSRVLYSPERRITGAILTEDAAAGVSHAIFAQPSLAVAGTTRTITAFARRVTGSRNLHVGVQKAGGNYAQARVKVDLGTGAANLWEHEGGTMTIAAFAATAVGDWWKVTGSLAFASWMPPNPYLWLKMANDAGADGFDGDGVSAVALWGVDIR